MKNLAVSNSVKGGILSLSLFTASMPSTSISQETLPYTQNIDINITNCVFQTGSKAYSLHRQIENKKKQGLSVDPIDVMNLFEYLEDEIHSSVSKEFLMAYIRQYNEPEIFLKVMEYAEQGTFDVDTIRELAETTLTQPDWKRKRARYLELQQSSDFNTRVTGLTLCITQNIDPESTFSPCEIISASRRLYSSHRHRGCEFRLGLLLREALETSDTFQLSLEKLDQIKMPLLRRLQTLDRRYRGSLEALDKDPDFRDAFIQKQAEFILEQREKIAERNFFGNDENLFTLLHSDSKFTYHTIKDLADGFGLSFNNQSYIKGSKNRANTHPKRSYFEKLNRLLSQDSHQTRIWHNMHGTCWHIYLDSGEVEYEGTPEETGNHVIGAKELGHLMGKVQDYSDTVIVNDTCDGWNFSELFDNTIITDKLAKNESLEEISLPIVISTAQNQMYAKGAEVVWYDGSLPKEKQKQVVTMMSSFLIQIIQYSQAKAEGTNIDDLKELGPTHGQKWQCDFRDFYNIDHNMAKEMEQQMTKIWASQRGVVVDPIGEPTGSDASLLAPFILDFDRVSKVIINSLEEEGYKKPEGFMQSKGEFRNSDHLLELSGNVIEYQSTYC